MEINNGGGGGGTGSSLTVTDGITPVVNVTTIDFTSGATVSNGGGGTANVALSGTGGGTVTSVDTAAANNGVTATWANTSTTPRLTVGLGAITPTSVAATGTVTGSNLSGTNTGDQTTITGNAGTATKLATARNINGAAFDGTANITNSISDLSSPTTDLSMATHKITNVTDPTVAQDAATKNYVDSVAQGLSVKGSVRLATAAALPTNTYLSNVITITATGVLTVDGSTVALNDRILVKDEASQLKNGVYVCTTAGAVGVAAILTRSTDMDVAAEFPGAFVFVEIGTANAAAGFVCTNSTPPTVGTTAITFTQFSGAGEITAGNGLSKTGNTLSIDTSITVDKTTAQTVSGKRNQPRVTTGTSTATLTLDKSTTDTSILTAQTVGLTIANPTGTPVVGEVITYYVFTASAQTLAFGTNFIFFGATAPTTTVAGKWYMFSAQYIATNTWAALTAPQV